MDLSESQHGLVGKPGSATFQMRMGLDVVNLDLNYCAECPVVQFSKHMGVSSCIVCGMSVPKNTSLCLFLQCACWI